MNERRYKLIRVGVAFFVGAIVSVAIMMDSYLLAVVGVVVGMLFMVLVRKSTKIRIDEREQAIREKAAQLTYGIFAPTIGIGAFVLLIPSKSGLSVFSRGEFAYLDSLGMIFAYLTLFLIAIYAISYHFLNRKFGGGGNEK